ncbi:MAG: ROK family protein [Rectinemataceae bacterium]
MKIAAIEAGGTKFICAVLETAGDSGATDAAPRILARASIPTGSPSTTLAACAEFFRSACSSGGFRLERLGIGSFGPVDLDPDSPTWGHITSTPKPGWRGADIAPALGDSLGLPVAFDTDVNAAALGEGRWGAGRGLSDFAYITVGTGIGGGAVSGGRIVHGFGHPEIGHIKVGRIAGDDFPGACPYHADCLEGLASGPAIGARWGKNAAALPDEHPAWDLEAQYLARAFASLTMVLSPERIIMGGGVGMRPGLAEKIGGFLRGELAGYIEKLDDPKRLAGYVVRPLLGADAGIMGAAVLAIERNPA